jgi:hypothetical protein
MIDISFFSPKSYEITDFIDDDIFFEKFVFEEENGHLSIEDSYVQNWESVPKLFNFIFKGQSVEISSIYENFSLKIYDLSEIKNYVLTFEDLENDYQNWIQISGHENTMDEYGMFVGIIGFFERNQNAKNIFVRVKSR